MQRVEKDYEELLQLFNKHRVRYCIVGAYAVAFHAVPRYTKDIDLFVEPSEKNAERIIQALEEFGFGSLKLTPSDFDRPGRIIQLGYEPVRVDLVTSIGGCTFKQVWKNRVKGIYGSQRVHLIGSNELIRSKRAAGRPQDKADLELLHPKSKRNQRGTRRRP